MTSNEDLSTSDFTHILHSGEARSAVALLFHSI